MRSIGAIPTQRLFVLAAAVKIISSVATLGFASGALNLSFWIFALIIPMAAMALYIWGGLIREDRTLSDEKFADSCYYLGFLFTIVSIVVSLIDLPSIGTNLNQIAVRFGVAMVSTAAGMAVRIYLVNFKRETNDALLAAEDALVEGADRFVERLNIAAEAYQRFEISVNNSTSNVTEHVQQRLERLSEDYSKRLDEQFQKSFFLLEKTSSEVVSRIRGMLEGLNALEREILESSRSNIATYTDEVASFSRRFIESIDKAALPEDHFSKIIQPALSSLATELGRYQAQLASSTDNLLSSADGISLAFKSLDSKTRLASKTIDSLHEFSSVSRDLLAAQHTVIEELQSLVAKFNELDQSESERDRLVDLVNMFMNQVAEIGREIKFIEKNNHDQLRVDLVSLVSAIESLPSSIATIVGENTTSKGGQEIPVPGTATPRVEVVEERSDTPSLEIRRL